MNIIKGVKSQAGLEWLTTYGWAMLLIFVMITGLSYFGVLSPSKLLPSRCNIGPEFSCIAYQMATAPNKQIKLKLKNNAGQPISLSLLTWETDRLPSTIECINSSIPSPSARVTMASGQINDFTWASCSGSGADRIISGEKAKILLTIQYNGLLSGASYTKEVKGEIFANVI